MPTCTDLNSRPKGVRHSFSFAGESMKTLIIALVVVIIAIAVVILKNRPKADPVDSQGITEHLAFLDTLRLPAISLSLSSDGGASRIGGLPSLPLDVPWPEWKGKPLAFLCQLDLSEIPENCERNGLPAAGMLYFFYNQEQETWGFDPNDKGSWQVIYTAASPEGKTTCVAPPGLQKDYIYAEKTVSFVPMQTYPDWQDERVRSLDMTDKQNDQYIDMCSKMFGNAPAHHLFGYPSPVQGNDMDLECQLASNGLYCGDASGYQDPKAKKLESGRSDWVLLLQLDTDDDAGMMWGDCGMLYFWIKKQDLAEGRFDKCWMILQCG